MVMRTKRPLLEGMMSDQDMPATPLENWCFHRSRVIGWVNEQQIVTSSVYSLRGNLLTTQSGSRYLLSEKTDGNNEWDKLKTHLKDRLK